MTSRLVAAVALAFLCVGPADAQVGPAASAETVRAERPFRGLFGEARGRAERDRFDVQFSMVESYDDNVLGDEGPQVADPRVNTRGLYSVASADAMYQHTGRRFSGAVTGGSLVRYYGQMQGLTSIESHTTAHLSATLGRTILTVGQTAQDTPFYWFEFFPAVGPNADVEAIRAAQPVRVNRAYRFNTTAAVTQTLSTRSDLSLSYGLRYTEDVGGGAGDFRAQIFRGSYRYGMTRYAAFRAGYGIEQGEAGASAPDRTRLDSLDLGVDYRRPLSFSRRTHIDAAMGSTAATTPGGQRIYRLLGDAGLTHEIGRTWSLRAAFHRGASLIEGLAAPAYSDAATVSLGGFLNRRVDVRADASYSVGEIGITGARNAFDTVQSAARVRLAISRAAAIFGEYAYYDYQFRSGDALPPGLPPHLRRQGVRVGLNVFLPVLE